MHQGHDHAAHEEEIDDPNVKNRYSFQQREVVCVGLGGNVAVFAPPWWSKTTLSFIATKFLVVGILEQVIAVVPLALYIILFEYIVIQSFIHEIGIIFLGLLACMIGLWLFIEGLKNGLIPLSEKLGYLIPTKTTKLFFFFLNPLIFFIVGTGVTVAEPAIIALKAIGSIVDAENKPYLYYMLSEIPVVLTFSIGIGCGIAFTIGYFKTQFNLDFKKLITIILIPTMLMTLGMTFDTDLKSLVALSWDCGAITTGEVTVPVIVGLGSGAGSEDPYSSLGLLAMASLMPVAAVQLLAIVVRFAVAREDIVQSDHHHVLPWYELSGVKELLETLEITIPLILFFLVLIKIGYKSDIPALGFKHLFHEQTEYLKRLKRKNGQENSKLDSINYMPIFLILTIIGLYLFNIGLHFGLAALGTAVGSDTPHLFMNMSKFEHPSMSFAGGLTVLLIFGFFLGYAANLAEPAMEILGTKVQSVTQGEFSKRMFVHSASVGVGVGVFIGILKIVYDIYLFYLLLPIYGITVVLTYFSSNAMAHIAWDAGAITTGPVTVPLVMGIGVAVAIQVKTFDGFGVLALASVCPITAVLLINMALEFLFPKASKEEYIEVHDMSNELRASQNLELRNSSGEHVAFEMDTRTDTELLPSGRNISNYGTTSH